MAYPGFRRRQPAWVLCRRDTWHSGFPQACWRFPTRGSGRNQRRQIAHGLFRASGMVMLYGHHAPALTVWGSVQAAWVNLGKQGRANPRERRRHRAPARTGRSTRCGLGPLVQVRELLHRIVTAPSRTENSDAMELVEVRKTDVDSLSATHRQAGDGRSSALTETPNVFPTMGMICSRRSSAKALGFAPAGVSWPER